MKVFTVIICALILILFGVCAASLAEQSAHDTQKAIEGIMKAQEGVMFVRMSRTQRGRIARAVVKYAAEFALNPYLVLGVIQTESAGRVDAVRGQCWGLMQVNKCLWFAEISHELSETDAQIRAGCAVLKRYIGKHGGDVDNALRSYGGYGPGRGERYLRSAKAYLTEGKRL